MTGEERRIPIPGTGNLRDLGGLATGDGRMVAPGRVFRAEAMVEPGGAELYAIRDPAHARWYASLRLRAVLDLRSRLEALAHPNGWGIATGAEVLHLPIEEGGEGSDTNIMGQLKSGELRKFSADDLAEFYLGSLQRRAADYACAIAVLAEPGRLPALVHCAAGKDRTGLLVALLLDLLGVDRGAIVEDYRLTGVFRPNRVLAYADVFGAVGIELDDVKALFETPPAAMEGVLDAVHQRHGGAAGFLVEQGGLDPAVVDRLRGLLLAPIDELAPALSRGSGCR